MPYMELYNLRQRQDMPSLDLEWFDNQTRKLSWVNSLVLAKTDQLDADVLSGLMLRNYNEADHGLTSDYVIITSAALDPQKEKIVAMKELMQVYRPDTSEQNATELGFDTFVRQFFGNSAMKRAKAVTSEYKALWMALGVVCSEKHRKKFMAQHFHERRPLAEIASEMEVHEHHAKAILSEQYMDEIQALLT